MSGDFLKRPFDIETAREVGHAAVTAAFVAVGSVTTIKASKIIISSSLNQDTWISIDGVRKQILMIKQNSIVLDSSSGGEYLKAGTTFYIMHDGAACTDGKLAISLIVQK